VIETRSNPSAARENKIAASGHPMATG
jgi:hypothetical protein